MKLIINNEPVYFFEDLIKINKEIRADSGSVDILLALTGLSISEVKNRPTTYTPSYTPFMSITWGAGQLAITFQLWKDTGLGILFEQHFPFVRIAAANYTIIEEMHDEDHL